MTEDGGPITETKCSLIRYMVKEDAVLQKYVAEYFGISKTTVAKHANRKCSHSSGNWPEAIEEMEQQDARGEFDPDA